MKLEEMDHALSYSEVSLVPRVVSTLRHRSEANTSVKFGPVKLKIPMIAAPMPDVCGFEMAAKLTELGALGILHRFSNGNQTRYKDPIKEAVAQFKKAPKAGASIGVTGDYIERFNALYKAGCRIFCLDTANGANKQVSSAIDRVRSLGKDVFLVTGNVASKQAYKWLEDAGSDAIRVGIAGGSVCETKTETGVLYPMASCIWEIAKVKRKALLIADGGIKMPADMCKALALGADIIMAGGLFSGADESPGTPITINGIKHKRMRGAASFSTQLEAGKHPIYVEGAETVVPLQGPVADIVTRYHRGLESSMSYMNAKNLKEYRANASFVRITHGL